MTHLEGKIRREKKAIKRDRKDEKMHEKRIRRYNKIEAREARMKA